MKVLYITLGCKVNQYETQSIREMLEKNGFSSVKEGETPDILMLNSCTVTAESDRKTRQTLRHYKRKYPKIVAVLLGCMPSAFPKNSEKLLEADIVFGNTDHSKIPILLDEFLKTGKRIISIENHEMGEKYITPPISSFSERTRAYMKIEDGCNRFCSYCAIPYARGRVRSRELESIKREAEALAQNGYQEIVLVGINLSAYGLEENFNLCDAVKTVAEVEGIKRIRLGSLEPDHITDEMLEALKEEPKFCPQFHLSLQSGSNATLKRMNRHYTSKFYEDLVLRIRKIFPLVSITTDIMVGFQGETEDEFLESLNFAKKIGFSKCHVFAYSEREGTAAVKLNGKCEKKTKIQRSAQMKKVAEASKEKFLESMLGLEEAVLFETCKEGVLEGYTANYTRVKAIGDKCLAGSIHTVLLESVQDDYIKGKILGEK